MIDEDRLKEYSKYLENLFQKARKNGGFDFICTLLRVGGMSTGHWDPMVEITEALDDFNKLLKETKSKKNRKREIRIGLLMYCHATEMSASYHILINLLRCIQNQHYNIAPFAHLEKRKKGSLDYTPAFASAKVKEIKRSAKEIGEDRLSEIFDEVFNKDIRNAFDHSDYCLGDDALHITEGGPTVAIPLDEVIGLINRALMFYTAFFQIYYAFKDGYKKLTNRLYKLPNYEVLELLINKDNGLYGFNVHFSNGQKATFERYREEVKAVNLRFDEGKLSFFVGDLSELKKTWMVNGQEFKEKQ